MIFQFFFPVSLIGWEVFYWLISYPIFLFSLPIIGLEGFSPATWIFETHQLSYGARIFLVVSWFSFSTSLIKLGGFSPGSHFSLTILYSIELTSKEGGNCNNVSLGVEISKRKSHDNNYLELHLSHLDLHHDALPSWAPTWSRYTFFLYVLDSLHTCLPIYLFHRYVYIPARRIFCLGIYLKSSTCRGMQLSSSIIAIRGEEVELPVGHNWRSSLAWQSALSSVLAKITG